MDKRRRLAASDEREPAQAELIRQIRQQAGRKIGAIDRRRREILWCPRADVQIKRIGLTRRARQQNEDDILRGI